jgi:hypothetical protein
MGRHWRPEHDSHGRHLLKKSIPIHVICADTTSDRLHHMKDKRPAKVGNQIDSREHIEYGSNERTLERVGHAVVLP